MKVGIDAMPDFDHTHRERVARNAAAERLVEAGGRLVDVAHALMVGGDLEVDVDGERHLLPVPETMCLERRSSSSGDRFELDIRLTWSAADAGGPSPTHRVGTTDDALRRAVAEELYWDPRLDADAIAVDARNGVVSLRGTVGSLRELNEAGAAAERVYGVLAVDAELDVRPPIADRRADADVRGAVLQALRLDRLVPSTVDVHVDAGVVRLTGTAQWDFERREAEFVASNVAGVLGVDDRIELASPSPPAYNVRLWIERALRRSAGIDAESVSIARSNGTVTLSGVVGSWAEHDAALDAVWAAPGVCHVDDRLVVRYGPRAQHS